MGLVNKLNGLLAPVTGMNVVREPNLYPWQQRTGRTGGFTAEAPLPAEAVRVLQPDNPRLEELRRRYAAFDPRATTPLVWVEGTITAAELQLFRGDNAYVWQDRGLYTNELTYALSYYELKDGSSRGLLERFEEDGLFGARMFTIDGRRVSRDLMDSAREIEFLTKHAALGSGSDTVLDIGAGYGRLPHRIAESGLGVRAFASDAYAVSTFVSEYYLNFRGSGATVVPLDEFDGFLAQTDIDVAVNVHSFSECRTEAIEWWVERIARRRVRYLMVISNDEARHGEIRCRTNDGRDMEAIFERCGYRIKVREPRHADPLVQRYAVDPAQLNLFELG